MGADSPFANVPIIADFRVRIEVWAILGCLSLFALLIELVRRNRLKERYSFLWFATSSVLLALTLKRSWLDDVAHLLGVYYPPTALFLILVFFMLLILVHFSTVISRLLDDKQTLSQSVGILESRVSSLEQFIRETESRESDRD